LWSPVVGWDWLWQLSLIGFILDRRFKDWAMIILAGLIGGLLVIVLAGGSIAYQGGFFGRRKSTA
jgi:hypothetical protein